MRLSHPADGNAGIVFAFAVAVLQALRRWVGTMVTFVAHCIDRKPPPLCGLVHFPCVCPEPVLVS